MFNSNLKEKIIDIIKKYSANKEVFNALPENPNLKDDLKINSARIVDIIIDIEDFFNIEIENDKLKSVKTLNDLINIISQKLASSKNE